PGRPRVRPAHVLGDKGYSSRAIRTWLRRHGIGHTIPERADQVRNRLRRGSRRGRPPTFDKQLYKRRNVVERCFNRLKQWRGIATRYDKTAESYQAAVTLASLLMWACHLKTTPSGSGAGRRTRGSWSRRARSCAGSGDPQLLKETEGGPIIVHGSASLNRSLSDAGLIDRYHLLVFPLLLGEGKRLFSATDKDTQRLKLVEHEAYANGLQMNVFDVVR
ncbi:transposase, partial [Streptomyces sp. PSKA54]